MNDNKDFSYFICSWYRGSTPLQSSTLGSWTVGGSLVIASVVMSDAGEYHCVANNSAGTSRYSTQLTITTPLSVQVIIVFLFFSL